MAIQLEKQNFQKVFHDLLREEVTILYDKCHGLKVDIAGWKELHEKSIASARAKEDIIKDLMVDNLKLIDKLVASQTERLNQQEAHAQVLREQVKTKAA